MIESLANRYSDLNAFCNAYSDKFQDEVSEDEKQAVLSDIAPMLIVVEKTYGTNSAVQWLMMQLSVFNEYCGKREKMDDWQIENLAKNIVRRYGWIKVSEMALFLNRYKNGEYGTMYGVVDPQELMVVFINKFIPWRAKIVEDEENRKKWDERDRWAKEALKPDEIRALKERIKNINDKFKES